MRWACMTAEAGGVPEDVGSGLRGGHSHFQLPVKAAGAAQGGVQGIRPVASRYHHHLPTPCHDNPAYRRDGCFCVDPSSL